MKTYLIAGLLALGSTVAAAEDLPHCPGGTTSPGQRYIAVINDLHVGNGRRVDNSWHPTEDFRWDGALSTFLDRITECSGGRADLVIAGDLLELWQPLPPVRCKRSDGCTPEEMVAIARHVLEQHGSTLAVFRKFALESQNRIHVVPGNHDAALLLPQVWMLFRNEIGAPADRLKLVASGQWVSADGTVLVEHGHQIGNDVNRYDAWPRILTSASGQQLLVQPWGENFVQSIFNAEEEIYPTIDNLSPESAGTRYRMADRGLWRSASDVARFVAFNLFETSLQQKVIVLGGHKPGDPSWDLMRARKLGYLLFANALPPKDAFRKEILGSDQSAAAVRAELDAMTADRDRTPDAEVLLLCDRIAMNDAQPQCVPPELGGAAERLLVPRKQVMIEHLRVRIAQEGLERVRTFIYGHTHLFEPAWSVDVNSFVTINVLNTGAFQRVVDEAGFLARVEAKPKRTPAEGLRTFQPEVLAPCYGAALVPYEATTAAAQTVLWYAEEGAAGRFVTTDDPLCR